MSDDDSTEHGIECACYTLVPHGANGLRGTYWPHMICQCGWRRDAETWAEVGALFDEHLAEHA